MILESSGYSLSEEVTYDAISPLSLILVVIADRDGVVGSEAAVRIFENLDQVPDEKRDFLEPRSDFYGSPLLDANYFSPLSTRNDLAL